MPSCPTNVCSRAPHKTIAAPEPQTCVQARKASWRDATGLAYFSQNGLQRRFAKCHNIGVEETCQTTSNRCKTYTSDMLRAATPGPGAFIFPILNGQATFAPAPSMPVIHSAAERAFPCSSPPFIPEIHHHMVQAGIPQRCGNSTGLLFSSGDVQEQTG